MKMWIKSLTGFVFICAVIEALIPEEPSKRALRMILGVIMSILIIGPIAGIEISDADIFWDDGEYISYEDNAGEMASLAEKQSKNLYEHSVNMAVEEIIGETVETEVIYSEENEPKKVIIHKNIPEKRADIASALGIAPAAIQMTE